MRISAWMIGPRAKGQGWTGSGWTGSGWTGSGWTGLGWIGLGLVVALSGGCKEEKKVKDTLYFDDLSPPIGLDVKVLKDESKNPASGSSCVVRAYVAADADRDELDRLLKSFYRQVKGRSGFRGGQVDKIDIRIYDSAEKAKAEGTDWLAAARRYSKAGEATLENKQAAPLLKWAKRELKSMMPIYTKALKPQILADPKAMTLEVTLPFVKQDGSGEWAEKVSFTRATTALAGLEMKLFGGIEKLRKLTFIGKHREKVLIKVTLTRAQSRLLNLRDVEEKLGAYQGSFMNKLIARKIDHMKVAKKVAKKRKKSYKEALARLPKAQVQLAKDLLKN